MRPDIEARDQISEAYGEAADSHSTCECERIEAVEVTSDGAICLACMQPVAPKG